MPILEMLVSAAAFWFITVWVSQNHFIDWIQILVWFIMAFGAGMLVRYAVLFDTIFKGNPADAGMIFIAQSVSLLVTAAVLYYALHNKFDVNKNWDKLLILLIYSLVSTVFNLFL